MTPRCEQALGCEHAEVLVLKDTPMGVRPLAFDFKDPALKFCEVARGLKRGLADQVEFSG
jgi:hypothetical protein